VTRWGQEEAILVTRDFMGPLGGFWSKPGRKRATMQSGSGVKK
jgi:hypothetical protein